VEIIVVSKCGNDICERSIDETGRNCCIDCDCSRDYGKGYFCYTGKTPNGECLSQTSINMRIREVQPNPANCIISQLGKQCAFTESMKAYPVILKPPSNLEISEAYYRIGSAGKYTNFTSLNCYKTGNGDGNYSCAFIIEPSGQTTPGDETRKLELKMSLAYTTDGAPEFKNVSDNFTFTVKRVYSDAVASCLAQQASLDKKLKGLESDKKLYTILAIVFLVLSLIFWIWYIVCVLGCTAAYGSCVSTCKSWSIYATIAGVIGGCGLIYVLNKLSSIDADIQQLNAKKQAICAAQGFGSLSGATSSSTNWIYTIGQLYGTVTCMMSVSGAIGGYTIGGTNSGGLFGGGGGGYTGPNPYANPVGKPT
jgi:hypothetical protein